MFAGHFAKLSIRDSGKNVRTQSAIGKFQDFATARKLVLNPHVTLWTTQIWVPANDCGPAQLTQGSKRIAKEVCAA
jgi:hypothetical protein